MKRILALAMILALACACVCCGPEKKEPDVTLNPSAEEPDVQSLPDGDPAVVPGNVDYYNLEIRIAECLSNATGICTARFLLAATAGEFTNFVFAVDTVYRGAFPAGTVTVTVENRFDYVQRYASLTANERVLLVLEPETGIPDDPNALRPVCECFIPLDRFLAEGSDVLDSSPFFHDMYAPTEAALLALCAQYAD